MATKEALKPVVFSILDFIDKIKLLVENGQFVDGGFDAEGLDVAKMCLSSQFEVSSEDPDHRVRYGVPEPHWLPSIFQAGLLSLSQPQQTQQPQQQQPTPQQTQSTPQPQQPVPQPAPEPQQPAFNTEEYFAKLDPKFLRFLETLKKKDYFSGTTEGSPVWFERIDKAQKKFQEALLQQAEEHKNEGNKLLTAKKYKESIECYSKALEINPKSAIYYCNRAAAYSYIKEYQKAVDDSKKAIEFDPKYGKAYSRLGLAHFSLKQYKEALEAYKVALEIDPNNQTVKDSYKLTEQKLTESAPSEDESAPNFSEFLSDPTLRGMAENFANDMGNQGGSTPQNFNDFLSNPAVMNMAQQFMQNPNLSQLLNNPGLASMAQNVMQDPNAMNQLFSQFMGKK